jgi:S1-C subfamily serine protease
MIKRYRKDMKLGLVAFALVILSTFFMIARPSNALADGGVPGGTISDPVVRAVDIAKPAVVRILTDINGQVTVHITSTQSATFPLNGGNYKLEFSGTGAFITAHGDILTADHVVNPPHNQDLDKALFIMASQDVATYINQNLNPTTPYSAQDTLSLMENGNFQTTTLYGQPSSSVYLSTDYTGPLSQTNFQNLDSSVWRRVDKIEQQSSPDVHDVALVHINMNNTPSIQLGDSSGVAQLDELTIIGFPGNADINSNNDPTQLLTSSVNKIYVSALKENDLHSPLIQVGGNVEHGDSGGPALDSNGNIVGIVSSYSSDVDYPLGTSFLQASNNAQALIQTQGLNTKPGPFEQAWKQAFTDYAATTLGHWHKAQQELQSILSHYSTFSAIMPYLNYAQNQASHEKLPTTQTSSSINYVAWFIGVAGFVLLILITLGALLFFTSKRYNQPLTAPATASPAPGWPPYQTGNVPSQPLAQPNNRTRPAEVAPGLPQPNFPATPPPVPVMWQQDQHRSANLPVSSPFEGLQRPFSGPLTPPPPSPFEEWQKSYELPTPPIPIPSAIWETNPPEAENPTGRQKALRRQNMVPDPMLPDPNEIR